jgi:hypothetical protein
MLLRLGPADPRAIVEAAAKRGVPLDVVTIDEPAVRQAYERQLVLVRPDGHAAWRADAPPPDPLALIDYVRGAAPGARLNAK